MLLVVGSLMPWCYDADVLGDLTYYLNPAPVQIAMIVIGVLGVALALARSLARMRGLPESVVGAAGAASAADHRAREFDRLADAVRAPLPLQPGSHAWFPLSQDPVTGEMGSTAEPVREAVEALHAWVQAVRGDFRTVSLLGFSQGMAMATSLLRLDPEAYACTVALSGFVVDPQLAEPQLRELFTRDDDVARVRPKVFWGRGQEDPIISEPRVEETHAWLNAHVDLMKIVYAGLGHAINEQELGHVKEYLAHMVPPRG